MIIARSQEFPDTTLFLRKDISQTLLSRIKAALFGMEKDPKG